MECTFTLKYLLPAGDMDVDAVLDRLAEEGCDDALVGVRQRGRLALEFVREAPSANHAIESTVEDVRRAVPNARLINPALTSWTIEVAHF
ncbi:MULTISPECIES: hypothetical protein [unclassified Pseudomonas]|uniref:hypothetical protein n=1 Tax=unclassified Pseudomonas TaxID=196821 RepID=UPI001CC1956A